MNTLRPSWSKLAPAGRLRRAWLSFAVLVSLAAVPIAATLHELQQHLRPADTLLNGPSVAHNACEICGALAGAGHPLAAKPPRLPILPAAAPQVRSADRPARGAHVASYFERAPPIPL